MRNSHDREFAGSCVLCDEAGSAAIKINENQSHYEKNSRGRLFEKAPAVRSGLIAITKSE